MFCNNVFKSVPRLQRGVINNPKSSLQEIAFWLLLIFELSFARIFLWIEGFFFFFLGVGCVCADLAPPLLHCQVEKSAFVVGDLGALMRQHLSWQSTMPQLQPYYPLRHNSSPAVVEVLASLGLGFVCVNKVCLHFARPSSGLIVLAFHPRKKPLTVFPENLQSTSLIGGRLMTPSGYATPVGHF